MKLNSLPTTEFEFDGQAYPIDLSFDNVLDVFEIINDDSYSAVASLELALEFLVGDPAKELSLKKKSALWQYIIETFLTVQDHNYEDKTTVKRDIFGDPLEEEQDRLIDYEIDADAIFTSFLMLGINLHEQIGKLQWDEFNAVLSSLPEDTPMSKIIEIRAYDPNSNAHKHDSKEYKRQMRTLKEKYRLPDRKEVK